MSVLNVPKVEQALRQMGYPNDGSDRTCRARSFLLGVYAAGQQQARQARAGGLTDLDAELVELFEEAQANMDTDCAYDDPERIISNAMIDHGTLSRVAKAWVESKGYRIWEDQVWEWVDQLVRQQMQEAGN